MSRNVNDIEEMLTAGVTITRPARMARFTRTAAEVIPTLRETDFQFGDLLLFPAVSIAGDDNYDDVDRRYLLYIYFNSINASQLEATNKNIFSSYKNEYTYLNRQLKIHHRVTNAFADAIQHYSEIIAAEAARKVQGKPRFVIKLQLHPVDQGFRARFCTLNEHTALLSAFDAKHYTATSRHWEYVTVSFSDLSTCFADKACFGNGMIYTAPPLKLKEVRVPCDLSAVIAAYWASMKTIYSCYVIVYRGSSLVASFKAALMPTLPLGWVIDGSVSSTLLPKPAVITRIHGPVTTFDRAEFTQRVKTLCETESRTSWITRFKKIVLETDAAPRAVVSMGFRKLENHFLQNANPPNLPLRKYQWIEVHKTICNVAIGLASLLPPPYVLLEIIDWLPNCYHSRHVQKINLIMALTTSMRRIQEGRTSRYGRVVRRVYDSKWQKIEK